MHKQFFASMMVAMIVLITPIQLVAAGSLADSGIVLDTIEINPAQLMRDIEEALRRPTLFTLEYDASDIYREIFVDGCDKEKSAVFCYDLALLNLGFRTAIKPDTKQGARYMRQACELGYDVACRYTKKYMNNFDAGIKEGWESMYQLSKNHCENIIAQDFFYLAKKYEACYDAALIELGFRKKESGIKPHIKSGVRRMRQACSLGSGVACHYVEHYIDNPELELHARWARDLCSKGHSFSCASAEKFINQ